MCHWFENRLWTCSGFFFFFWFLMHYRSMFKILFWSYFKTPISIIISSTMSSTLHVRSQVETKGHEWAFALLYTVLVGLENEEDMFPPCCLYVHTWIKWLYEDTTTHYPSCKNRQYKSNSPCFLSCHCYEQPHKKQLQYEGLTFTQKCVNLFARKFKLDLYLTHRWLQGKPRQQAFTFTRCVPATWFVSNEYFLISGQINITHSVHLPNNTVQDVNFKAFARSVKTVLVDSANRETIHSLWETLGTAINNSVYTALCKQKAGTVRVFV